MVLVERSDGVNILHTGDFRAHDGMLEHPSLQGKRIDTVSGDPEFQRLSCNYVQIFLDTTYCNPRHAFPEQSEVLKFTSEAVCNALKEDCAKEGSYSQP